MFSMKRRSMREREGEGDHKRVSKLDERGGELRIPILSPRQEVRIPFYRHD